MIILQSLAIILFIFFIWSLINVHNYYQNKAVDHPKYGVYFTERRKDEK